MQCKNTYLRLHAFLSRLINRRSNKSFRARERLRHATCGRATRCAQRPHPQLFATNLLNLYNVRNSRNEERVPCRMVDSICQLEAMLPPAVLGVAHKNNALHVNLCARISPLTGSVTSKQCFPPLCLMLRTRIRHYT